MEGRIVFPQYKNAALMIAGVLSVAFSPVSIFAKDAGGGGGGGDARAAGGAGDAHAAAAPSAAPARVSEAPRVAAPELLHGGAAPNATPAAAPARAAPAEVAHDAVTANAAPAQAAAAGQTQVPHDSGDGPNTVIINGYPNYGNYPWYSWVPGETSTYAYPDSGNANSQQQATSPQANTTATGNGPGVGQAANSVSAPTAVPLPTGVATSALAGSTDWVKADADVHQAQAQYDQASSQVLARLQNDPEYIKAVQARNQAAQQAQHVQPSPQAGVTAQVEGAATKDMDASNRVTQLQADALAKDQAASAASARLSDAIAKRDAILRQIATQAR